MGWVVYGLSGWWWPGDAAALWWQAVVLAALILVGVLTYTAAAAALRAPELPEARTMVTHRSIRADELEAAPSSDSVDDEADDR
jgi:hypothetical protein